MHRGRLHRRERPRLDPGAALVKGLGTIDRLEVHDVAIEVPDRVATDVLVDIVLVEIDVQRKREHLLGLRDRQLRQLLASPQDTVVIEGALLPFGPCHRVPEERVVKAHVDAVAAADLAVVRQQGVGTVVPEPVFLIGHERLVCGHDLFGGDQCRALAQHLLLLCLKALDWDPCIQQDERPRVQGHRHAGRVALEVRCHSPARWSGGPTDDVVDCHAAHCRGGDHETRTILINRLAREEPDQPLERFRVEKGVGRHPLNGPRAGADGGLERRAGSRDTSVRRQKEAVEVEEHAPEFRLPVDIGLEVEAHHRGALALRHDELAEKVRGPLPVARSFQRQADHPELRRGIHLEKKIVDPHDHVLDGDGRRGPHGQHVDVGGGPLSVQGLLPRQVFVECVLPQGEGPLRHPRFGIDGTDHDRGVLQDVRKFCHPVDRPAGLAVRSVPYLVVPHAPLEMQRGRAREVEPALEDCRPAGRWDRCRCVDGRIRSVQAECHVEAGRSVRVDDAVDLAPVILTGPRLEQAPRRADAHVERMVGCDGGILERIGQEKLLPLTAQVVLVPEPEHRESRAPLARERRKDQGNREHHCGERAAHGQRTLPDSAETVKQKSGRGTDAFHPILRLDRQLGRASAPSGSAGDTPFGGLGRGLLVGRQGNVRYRPLGARHDHRLE